MLKDTKLSHDFSFETLAEQADGLSGSDLKELCRNAAMVPAREFMRNTSNDHEAMAKGQLEVRIFFTIIILKTFFIDTFFFLLSYLI